MKLKYDRLALVALLVGGVFVAVNYFKPFVGKKTNTKTTDGKTHRWQMTTTWNNNLPLLQANVEKMVKEIETTSRGELIITLTDAPKDANGSPISTTVAPALFKAVNKNDIQVLHSAAYYWKKDIPGAVYFGSVPFGLSHGEVKQWLDNGGLELWRELYEHYKINAVPFSCGHTGEQMGGWFKKEIKTPQDMHLLRMRIAGLGGDVLKNCFDISPSSQLPSEIFTAMQNGTLDAAEWIGPFDDYRLGLHTLDAFYYQPGWQERNTMFELLINKDAYNALSPELQEILKNIIEKYDSKIYQDYIDQNQIYKATLENKLKVKFRYFPSEVMKKLYQCTKTTLESYNKADTSGYSKKIYDSYIKFRGKSEWQ